MFTATFSPGTFSFVLPEIGMDFDAAGRPVAVHEKGFFRARGFDGRWVEKKWVAGGMEPIRHLRVLTAENAAELEHRVRERLEELLALARRGLLSGTVGKPLTPKGWARRLETILAFQDRLAEDAAYFRRIYHPIGVLPPDQYLAWVVQAVEGCSWNRCAFCGLFAGRGARVRSRADIRRHMEETEAYFGPAMDRRVSAFIGDADAFAAPPSTLIWLCREISRRQPRLVRPSEDGAWGIHSFGEVRSLLRWTSRNLKALARSGFRRATIGVESGDEEVRRWLRKPGRAEDVRRAVARVKEAGLSVGIVALLGAGGREADAGHREKTARLLRVLPLDENDLVYLSPLKDGPDDPHRRALMGSNRSPAGPALRSGQAAAFRAAALDRPDGRRPRVALYDVDDFLY